MLNTEEKPYVNIIEDWLKRIGYDAGFYESHTPVRVPSSVKRLTKRERERVEALSKERGFRRFQAITRTI